MKSLALAEAAEEGIHMKQYEVTLKAMTEKFKAKEQAKKGVSDGAKSK
jgi:hypothetical protein